MNCKYCGNRVDPEWFSCKGCGAPVEAQEPITGRPYQIPDSWSDCSGHAMNISPAQEWAYTSRIPFVDRVLELNSEEEYSEPLEPIDDAVADYDSEGVVIFWFLLIANIIGFGLFWLCGGFS